MANVKLQWSQIFRLPPLGCFLILFGVTTSVSKAQIPPIEWQNTIGGSNVDYPGLIIPTTDIGNVRGYLVCGHTSSGISGDKTEASLGGDDLWVLKLDSLGNILWQNTIGGSDQDHIGCIDQTFDHGYILGAHSFSGISGDKTEANQGDDDFWIIKLDTAGNIVWQNTIGGSDEDVLTCVEQTSDHGYIIGGDSYSGISGDKTEASRGNSDYWVLKLDSLGNIQWQKTLGGTNYETLAAVHQTLDGGYILGGHSNSGQTGDKTESSQGSIDYWIVKLGAAGNIQWQNTIGGNDLDRLGSVALTMDGGYIIGGFSMSGVSGDKTDPNNGSNDYWPVKLDSAGNIEWQHGMGGSGSDVITSISQTMDGGYMVGGHSSSGVSGNKTEPSQGNFDHWLVKLNTYGDIEDQKVIGGSDQDFHRSITQIAPNEYILVGNSNSGLSGDKTEGSLGTYDYWVIKLGNNPILLPVTWGDIQAEVIDQTVQISWSLPSEINVEKYEVERSTDGIDFLPIVEVLAHNAKGALSYSWIDQNPNRGINYYRIRQVDLDGQYSYSTIVQAAILQTELSLYPNPVKDQFWINAGAVKQLWEVQIFNALGSQVRSSWVTSAKPMDVRGLDRGIYMVRINTDSEVIIKQILVE